MLFAYGICNAEYARTFYRALGAGQALTASFEAARAAIRNGSNKNFQGEAAKFVLLCSDHDLWLPREAPFLSRTWWPPWPRVEDYVGRETLTVSLAKLFEHRRAVCLWGTEGSGKTALCLEFCRFFSAPGGRRFSAGAFHVKVDHGSGLLTALLDQLGRGLNRWCEEPKARLQLLAQHFDELGHWLVVVDGLAAPELAEAETRELLSQLLERTTNLHLLLTARVPLHGKWTTLGSSKVVDLPLPHLEVDDAARLLASRARRPFFHQDWDALVSPK
eukprot:g57.t1